MIIKKHIIVLYLILIGYPCHAVTYNVSNDMQLATANLSVSAGDIVNIFPGTYLEPIRPFNSGTSGNPIIYQGAAPGVIIFDGQRVQGSKGVHIENVNFITVQRGIATSITYTKATNNIYVSNSNNIILKDLQVANQTDNSFASSQIIYMDDSDYITLDGIDYVGGAPDLTMYQSSRIQHCSHLEIKNCSFDFSMIPDTGGRDGLVIVFSDHIHIHGNYFGTATHASLEVGGNNTDVWIHDNVFTNRLRHGLSVSQHYASPSWTVPSRVVVENNLFYQNGIDAGINTAVPNYTYRPAATLRFTADRVIARFNTLVECNIGIIYSTEDEQNVSAVYHNTLYDTRVHGVVNNVAAGTGSSCGVNDSSVNITNGKWKNNIISRNPNRDITWDQTGTGVFGVTGTNNFIGYINDFVVRFKGANYYSPSALNANSDWSGTIGQSDPVLIAPDYRPGPGSPVIDAGVFLATVVSVGPGNTLNLEDNEAFQFFDGYGISGAVGDTIYSDNSVSTTITGIVDHNTIEVLSTIGILAGHQLTVMNYSGILPDIGRYEYSNTTAPVTVITSPVGLQTGSDPSSWTFSGTCDDADGDQVSGSWNFDGGATNYSCSMSTSPLTCDAGPTSISGVGDYSVTLTCTDSNNATSSQSVRITIGSPTATSVFEWEMEAANIVLDNRGNQNLTNNGPITTGGSEPDPPGRGSVGAVLDDSVPQYFSISNANLGNNICNGTGTECTIIMAINADDLGSDYLFSLYHPGADSRQYALAIYNGVPTLFWGHNSGLSYQEISINNVFAAGEDIIIGLSIDVSEKTYTFLAQNVSTGQYYEKTESDTALLGIYDGTLGAMLAIGSRSDAVASRSFDGKIWWVRAYNNALTRYQMESIFENTTQPGDISRCYLGEDRTYSTGEIITIYCTCTSTGVDKTGGSPYIELEMGSTDLQCALQTADSPAGVTLLTFQGTVESGMMASLINATANGIQLNGGDLGGIDVTVATSGPGSIGYESPNGAINTSTGGIFTAFEPCDSIGNTLTHVDWILGDIAYFKLTGSQAGYFNHGQVGNFRIPIALSVGETLSLAYSPSQPDGMGNGTANWIFSAEISSGMLDLKVGDGVGALDRDHITTGSHTIIENSGGVEMESYAIPVISADSVEINGTAGIRRIHNATGSVVLQ